MAAVEFGFEGPPGTVAMTKGRPTTLEATRVVMPRLVGIYTVKVEFGLMVRGAILAGSYLPACVQHKKCEIMCLCYY